MLLCYKKNLYKEKKQDQQGNSAKCMLFMWLYPKGHMGPQHCWEQILSTKQLLSNVAKKLKRRYFLNYKFAHFINVQIKYFIYLFWF